MFGSPICHTFSSGAHATVTLGTGRACVVVRGEVDATFEESGAAIIELLAGQGAPAEIDLSGVTLFCAAGVNWLTSLHAAVAAPVRVMEASDPVRMVLAACGVPLQSLAGTRSATGRSMCMN